ncbi:MAG TPA: NADP-dependent oxidoreductase [Caulobacteraceae bacterium]|jgi:NADPH:quinone reductase-like Zn-dependent oxidoreductase|nr:NADP-dependent oxidoreductase [Caulobacteraceae bacterium]
MKAVRIHRFGGPEVLQLDEIDRPSTEGGKMLIRVAAASVNPVDYKIRRGGYPRVTEADLPITLGRDVAGVVESAAGDFKVGDEVYAHLDWADGGYAEYAGVVPGGAAPKPETLDMVAAAAVPLAATTAWQGLFDHGGLKAGQRVLIHGGSGGVGGFAVQFAKDAGAYVFATASGDGLETVRGYGADEAIDYERQRFEDVAHDIDLVYDLIGGDTQTRSYAVLKDGGTLISTVQEPDKARAAEKHLKAERYMAVPNGAELRRIAGLIDAGKVKVEVARTFPLAQAADAHRFLEDQHPHGKVVLTV